MTRLLAIDPGPTASAYVLYVHERDPMTRRNVLERPLLEHAKEANETVLARIYRVAAENRGGRWVDQVCIEKIESFGMAVGEDVFETVFWSGRFAEAWCSYDAAGVARVPRGEVKMHLCRSMRAKDPNIRAALIDRFGQPGTRKAPGRVYGVTGDVWSALAVAVTVAEGGHVERGLKVRPPRPPRLREVDALDDPRAPLFP
jgi:hypothetical protein